tara:strand:- start:1943 stop:2362 length:420 start_codon:yes stop_codon:yes gene_type:complete
MKIIIGSDHAGFTYKSTIISYLQKEELEIIDVGTFSNESVDYPDYAHLVSKGINSGSCFGILICGSGNGVSMAANKHKNIRSAVCWNVEIASLARRHNNSNIISIPARFVSEEEAVKMITVFLKEKFEGGRHLNRVKKI